MAASEVNGRMNAGRFPLANTTNPWPAMPAGQPINSPYRPRTATARSGS